MSYAYEYIEGLKQFDIIHLTLKLTDSDNILPEVILPVVLSDSEYNQDNLIRIANELIDSYTITESIITDEPVILEEILNNVVDSTVIEPVIETILPE